MLPRGDDFFGALLSFTLPESPAVAPVGPALSGVPAPVEVSVSAEVPVYTAESSPTRLFLADALGAAEARTDSRTAGAATSATSVVAAGSLTGAGASTTASGTAGASTTASGTAGA